MRNVTVSVPDDVYRAARITAAERGTSVSAIVSAYLRTLSAQEDAFEQLRRKQDEIVARITGFRAGDSISRDELHDRGLR